MKRRAAFAAAAAVFILGLGAFRIIASAAPEKSASVAPLEVTYYYLPS